MRVVVASVETPDLAQQTQAECPHLQVVADPELNLVKAAGLVHKGVGPGRTDVAAPTTVLLDRGGVVRWFYQPPRHIVRLTPDEMLAAIDRHLPRTTGTP